MPSAGLTPRDIDILNKIRDPEYKLSAPILIDNSLARDPHITNPDDYKNVTSSESQIIREFQDLEQRIAALHSTDVASRDQLLTDYDTCIAKLLALSAEYPSYASVHNNKAQSLRRKFGDSVLLRSTNPPPGLFVTCPLKDEDFAEAAKHILTSLENAISLLSPPNLSTPISPQAAKTLSQAYTQRGVLYHTTAKQMVSDPNAILRLPRNLLREDLEEMASSDFMMGGRYGNEFAKSLAVATNPTAKLCGDIMRQAMRFDFEGLPP
jgi:hypothetical protein